MQVWEKLGRIYCPNGDNSLFKTHAYLPTPTVLEDRIRVYFASYDKNKRGRITFIDLDKENPKKILYIHNKPIVNLGEPGTFDCDGVSPSCIFRKYNKFFLYYVGWQRTEAVPFMLYIGLAESDDGIAFKKYSRAPILDRIDEERFIRSAPFVIDEDNNKYTMYYVSSPRLWGEYCIYRLESWNLYCWNGVGKIAIPIKPQEFGIGRPYAIKENNIYRMWYSYRGNKIPYKIGYAESIDGYVWKRKDEDIVFIDNYETWDNEMMCVPYIIDVGGDKRLMFYNGNGMGRSGFGYAKLHR
uniref:Glycosyl hydrolase family 32 N-terminal domain-containing protein n=1 Tax=viral metagenome TaxID=1070528 RepID=A0A6H1ZK29_9ZZZZ